MGFCFDDETARFGGWHPWSSTARTSRSALSQLCRAESVIPRVRATSTIGPSEPDEFHRLTPELGRILDAPYSFFLQGLPGIRFHASR